MKLAISGKGGVGKSTLTAALALLLARRGTPVLALDADPDANLASSLGISQAAQKDIVPISRQKALIEERTGAKVKQYGQMFKINPEVADIAAKYATLHRGVALIVLGAVQSGGGGCACPESVLMRALVTDLVLHKDEAFIMDMEAGVEHLGRATARGVDSMIVVVEPGLRSIESARRVERMAADIGLKRLRFVANKVQNPGDELYIRESLGERDLIGVIPWSEELRQTDRDGVSTLDAAGPDLLARFESILQRVSEEPRP